MFGRYEHLSYCSATSGIGYRIRKRLPQLDLLWPYSTSQCSIMQKLCSVEGDNIETEHVEGYTESRTTLNEFVFSRKRGSRFNMAVRLNLQPTDHPHNSCRPYKPLHPASLYKHNHQSFPSPSSPPATPPQDEYHAASFPLHILI